MCIRDRLPVDVVAAGVVGLHKVGVPGQEIAPDIVLGADHKVFAYPRLREHLVGVIRQLDHLKQLEEMCIRDRVKSDDPAAVRMGIIIGPDLLNSYAHQCGVTTDIPPYPSSYLGACDISLNELTGIYATFANQGVWVRQHIVVQVKDEKDRVIYQLSLIHI